MPYAIAIFNGFCINAIPVRSYKAKQLLLFNAPPGPVTTFEIGVEHSLDKFPYMSQSPFQRVQLRHGDKIILHRCRYRCFRNRNPLSTGPVTTSISNG